MMKTRCHLQAINPPQNIFRYYTLEAGQNLFGEWIIRTQFGRISTKGTVKSYVCDNKEACLKICATILNKRFSSTKRIGVAYKIVEF